MNDVINDFITNDDVNKAVCRDTCEEEDKIKWDIEDGKYAHVRIDGKYITTNAIEKCDCLILFYNIDVMDKTIFFLIETKEKNPSITKVINQLQSTINEINCILQPYQRQILLTPVVYLESISSINHRILLSMKINYNGKKLAIVQLKNGSNILEAIKHI
jgi:hypothetical protein